MRDIEASISRYLAQIDTEGQSIHAGYYASNRELAQCGFSDASFGLPEGKAVLVSV